jgi:hypothetical protein
MTRGVEFVSQVVASAVTAIFLYQTFENARFRREISNQCVLDVPVNLHQPPKRKTKGGGCCDQKISKRRVHIANSNNKTHREKWKQRKNNLHPLEAP